MKSGCALALAALLALPCLNLLQARAAGPIIEDQECRLTVSVNAAMLGDDVNADDLAGMDIPVELYKVADVDASGVFHSTETFADIDFNIGMDQETNADTWSTLAEETVGILAASREEPLVQAEITAGTAVIDHLSTGMYLIVPRDTWSGDTSVKYVFTPYLTALPASEYTVTGAGSDEWQYEREIFLKGEAQAQFGRLTIRKTLENYNETLGQVTCVFRIDGRDAQGNLVYSNVAGITLGSAGTESATIENIPAGLDVTVTEVYAGASYEVVGDHIKETTIVSDTGVESGMDQASVSFTNQYNGGNRGGYGVTNEFTVSEDGEWEWNNPVSPNTPPAN